MSTRIRFASISLTAVTTLSATVPKDPSLYIHPSNLSRLAFGNRLDFREGSGAMAFDMFSPGCALLPNLFLKSVLWGIRFRLPCLRHFFIHIIHLFEGQTFSLIDANVNEYCTSQTARTPDEEHLGLQTCCTRAFINQVWSCKTDRPVEKPVTGDRTGNRLCTESQREVLTLGGN